MTTAAPRALPWLDRLKAVAFLWIVLNHIVEQMVGSAAAGNPSVPWPALAERIAQFGPVRGAGILTWPLTIVRDLGWFGDQGVTLFLILSGFGLTYGLLARDASAKIDAGIFYRRRLFRIFPMWWGVHLLLLPIAVVFASVSTGDWQLYASLAGFRFLPGVFYYFSPAWWYVGLILQLYLVFPLLWRILRARGPFVLLAIAWSVGFLAIAAGPYLFHNGYLDPWQRGAFFITRMPEFAFGMALATWWFARPEQIQAFLRRPMVWFAAVVAYAAGTALSFTLAGMIVAPTMLGIAAFALLFGLVARPGTNDDVMQFIGRHSYALYLTHDFFVSLFLSGPGAPARIALGIVAALVATGVAAWLLERGTLAVGRGFSRLRARRGTAAATGVVLALGALVSFVPIALDLAVWRFAPQEVFGWGERSSLQPSAQFGFNLIPSRTTHLRWQSYDYRVTSNALGFPAPEFGAAKPKDALRILVVGDAFTSAEGVDTADSWPRVLQNDLARRAPSRRVQVMDFGITGYGPNEEAAVVRAFVPRFHPDIVLVEMFSNAVEQALLSEDQQRRSIGFGRLPQEGFLAVVTLAQLRAYLQFHVEAPLKSFLTHKPASEGYFLGNFRFLERGHDEYDGAGVRNSIARYREIAAAARASGAQTIVAFIPPPARVCDTRSLAYYPRDVHLDDTAKYDLALPERRAREITAGAHLGLWDMQPDLRALPVCPYMPHNMHFTVAGQRAFAALIANRLANVR